MATDPVIVLVQVEVRSVLTYSNKTHGHHTHTSDDNAARNSTAMTTVRTVTITSTPFRTSRNPQSDSQDPR